MTTPTSTPTMPQTTVMMAKFLTTVSLYPTLTAPLSVVCTPELASKYSDGILGGAFYGKLDLNQEQFNKCGFATSVSPTVRFMEAGPIIITAGVSID